MIDIPRPNPLSIAVSIAAHSPVPIVTGPLTATPAVTDAPAEAPAPDPAHTSAERGPRPDERI